jgi:hypothetical protein
LRKLWFRDNKLKDDFEVFVVEEKEKMLGFIVYKVDQDYGYIDNILVAKKEQKRVYVVHLSCM